MIQIDPIQRHLFFEGIFLKFGYDFRQYSEASLNRRLEAMLIARRSPDLLSELNRVFAQPEEFREIIPHLTVNTTQFFRDPEFYKELRESVFPVLKTYPRLRIWSAGCSTGQEVISLSILLQEEGLLDRTTIYATDINPRMIRKAKEGIFDLASLQLFAKNYSAASGLKTPSDYYTADYGAVRFSPRLLENVVFSEHNLVTDEAFAECHLIICRNVLIYFNRELQERVLQLFRRSLTHKGFLGLGNKESITFSKSAPFFKDVGRHRIFQLKASYEAS